ncbi:cyanoexosortase A system-associated protein [Pseudanabaenaceae cyanobacterium LEGE 13415]|nr:cyanoexosortase A system-associated protein [Pseudanabaenaceae cyanobacterium LEGE 13415]
MKTWEKIRNIWLATALVSSSLVVLRLAFTPVQKPAPLIYTFPASVPLSRWQFVKATPIGQQRFYTPSLATSIDDLMISGQQYRYLRNGKPLDIEVRYFRNYGTVSDIVRESTIWLDRVDFTDARTRFGTHAIYEQSGRRFLTACITPIGETTVTKGEFNAAPNRPDMMIGRSLPWLLGQKPLRDLRCLWTRISTPINPSSSSATEQDLEQAWMEWVQWWQNNYPPEP